MLFNKQVRDAYRFLKIVVVSLFFLSFRLVYAMNDQAVLDGQLNLYLPQIVVKSPDGDGYFQASLRYTQ